MKPQISKGFHIIFDLKDMKYIGIGEDHNGLHAFDFKNSSHIEYLKKFLLKRNNSVNIWYEGPNISAKSKSFQNFENELRKFQTDHKINFRYLVKGWDADLKFDKMQEYAGILLGAEVYDYANLIGISNLNGKKTLLQAMVDCKKIKGTQLIGPTIQEAKTSLTESSGAPCDVLEEMMKDGSATMQTLQKIYGGGNNAMRAKYFYGTPGAKTNSAVYKRVDEFNKTRDRHLAKKMKQEGGIFLAGDGHIEFNLL